MKINIYVQPGAKKTAYDGEFNGCIKIKIKSPPTDGKANEELINFISQSLDISKKEVVITSGEKSRYKIIEVPENYDMEVLKEKLKD